MGQQMIQAKKGDYERYYQDSNKWRWGYYSEEKMMELFPNGGFQIYGDFRRKTTLPVIACLVDGENKLEITAYTGQLKRNEKVAGYIPLEFDDGYVRIVQKKKGKILLYLSALFFVLALFFGGLWLGQQNRPIDNPVKIASGSIANPDSTNIRLPGIEYVYATAGDPHVNQLLLNVEGNAVNLTYEIRLDETNELIYRSKVIKPGYGVREFNMERTFEEGKYPISITALSSAQEDDDSSQDTAYNAGQLKAILIVE